MNVHTVQPHPYSPDYQAMGDCRTCGHLEDSPLHRLPEPDRGARALAERLETEVHGGFNRPFCQNCENDADALLGKTGLFIADVRKHEPGIDWLPDHGAAGLTCSCGWKPLHPFESYFSHIGAAQ